ncbi:hypothetical protein AUC68_04530 [Methyloceanibacter methanicus]|uniref:Uncharacterized protein n=1 Tax=Methyloceanibacter methanicus TaxID=1774968 RepID=A0A1E3W0I7_9HYPH|nr:hypothetical protein [Methyloceanibacter methanicus]ODR99273.1 hypothetical protein AUC68_04530 [Methyloceanibacter methanicus]
MNATTAPNFGVLLIILCLLIVVAPMATTSVAVIALELLFDAVFIAGAYWLASGGQTRRVYLGLTVSVFVARWVELYIGGVWLQVRPRR